MKLTLCFPSSPEEEYTLPPDHPFVAKVRELRGFPGFIKHDESFFSLTDWDQNAGWAIYSKEDVEEVVV